MTQWAIRRVSGPPVEPVTTTGAKKHLRVEGSADDTYIAGLVQGAREYVEHRTNRAFVEQTFDYTADDWPDGTGPIELPRSPLRSVASVKYTKATSTGQTTLSATTYFVDTENEPGRVVLRDGETWPTDRLRPGNGVQVRFDAGYATSATGAPERAKNAIKLLVGHWYANRETVAIGTISTPVEFAVDTLVGQLTVRRFV